MIISETIDRHRLTQKWSLACARPYYRADGQFGGVVFAAVALDHLAENILGQQMDIGEGGLFGLVTTTAST